VQLDLFDVIARGDDQRTRWTIGPTHSTTSGRTTNGLRRAA
jgi:hypothetical protein